jgi:clan AA aspartic protease (TIGR02281 family)
MKNIILLITLFFTASQSIGQSYNFEQGYEAYKKEDYEKALDYLSRDINDNPKAALTHYYRSLIYRNMKENSKALKDINEAIQYFNSKEKKLLSASHVIRAEIYYNIDNTEKTIEDYAIAIKLEPNNPSIYIYRAEIFYELDRYKDAENDYKKALEIDESLPGAYAGLGRNYIVQKQYNEAEKILNKLIKLSPEFDIAYQYRAWLNYEQGNYDNAINDIFKSILLDETNRNNQSYFLNYSDKNYALAHNKLATQIANNPDKELWYLLRTSVYENENKYFRAIEDYNKLLKITEENTKASMYYYRGKCYMYANQYNLSVLDLNQAIQLDSTKADYYAYRGLAKRYSDEIGSAENDFSKAIAIEPEESWYYAQRAAFKEKIVHNTDGAIEDYNMAISLYKNRASDYLHRGRIYKRLLKNDTKAKEDFERILVIDTVIKAYSNCRHYALLELGKEKEALDWLTKILEKYPTEGNYYDAACIYSLMNKPKEAIENLKFSLEKGNINFKYFEIDDDLDPIRNIPEFNTLVNKWKFSYDEIVKKELEIKKDNHQQTLQTSQTITIPLKSKGTGTYEISCKINDLVLNLIFDTGASEISISQTEVQFMLKNNYLSYNDIIGTKRYMDANGDIEVGTTVIFKKVDFGGLILNNVKASVVHNKNAPLLFGQSAIGKYGKFTIDNIKKTITIETNKEN